jgi:hypothetical protein
MNDITIITGLPRCRSAWLSAFFDVVHEPLRECEWDWGKVEEYGRMDRIIIDTSAPFFYKQLNDLWPTSFWVFIERDPAPVRQWITQVFPSLGSSPDAVMAQLEKALADAKRAVPDRSITCDFDKIDAGWMLPLVWERSKSNPWDEQTDERFSRFRKLHIEALEFRPPTIQLTTLV